jgi:hypothetical protein
MGASLTTMAGNELWDTRKVLGNAYSQLVPKSDYTPFGKMMRQSQNASMEKHKRLTDHKGNRNVHGQVTFLTSDINMARKMGICNMTQHGEGHQLGNGFINDRRGSETQFYQGEPNSQHPSTIRKSGYASRMRYEDDEWIKVKRQTKNAGTLAEEVVFN